jgi:hypothetical protein
MTKEDKNLSSNETSEQDQSENQQHENDASKKNPFIKKVWGVIKRNPISSVLLISLVVAFTWFSVKSGIDKKQFEREKNELITKHVFQLDSLQLKNIEFSSRVFSWSVRSELLRTNVENLNQLLTVFVKESNANLVQLVNLEDNTIIISSDKKFEGTSFMMPKNVNLDKQVTTSDETKITVLTPVMGFNDKIGLLVVEISKEKLD